MSEGAPWRVAGEAERDLLESGFTVHLRSLFRFRPEIVAVAFVDYEGECVDYCAGIDPFEAKVAGAHLTCVIRDIRPRLMDLVAGDAIDVAIVGTNRDRYLRRVTDEYTLVVILEGGSFDFDVMGEVDRVAAALRAELGERAELWDVHYAPLHVETRGATGWEFAPSMVQRGDRQIAIEAVIGRWEEEAIFPPGRLICFRVRIDETTERTLAFDERLDRWFAW